MTNVKLTLCGCALIALSACQDAPEEPPVVLTGNCGADTLQYLVGQGQGALAAMTFPDTTRFITPGMAVTMDYRLDRLNILMDADGQIEKIYCG